MIFKFSTRDRRVVIIQLNVSNLTGCFLLLVLGVPERMFSAPGTRCPGQDVFYSWY